MRYSPATLLKIAEHIAAGATIVENKNWRYTGKRAGYINCIKLAQTNDRRTGWAKRIIWACYKTEGVK